MAYRQTMDDRFPQLAPLAFDLLMASLSEAYMERIFSLCDDLTTGKCDRMQQSLIKLGIFDMNSPCYCHLCCCYIIE